MGIPASIGIGAAGGALLAGGILFAGSDHNVRAALGAGAVASTGGALAGLAAGLLSRRGTSPVKAALLGTSLASALPVGLLAASQVGDDGWGNLGQAVAGLVIGAGTIGGGAALLGHALLRR